MKTHIKRSAISVILVILAAMLLCSCSNDVTPIPENTSSDTENTDPPQMLIFADFKAYLDFEGSVSLSDEDFAAFISDNSYDMNGVQSKDDVKRYCETIDKLPVPEDPSLTLRDIVFYPEREECSVTFTGAGDAVYSLDYYTGSDKKKGIQDIADKKLTGFSAASADIDSVYDVTDADDDFYAYYAIIDGYRVLYRAYDTDENNALSLLENSKFAALSAKTQE